MKFFIVLLLFSGSANAGMYKCKDDKGHISYSQHPCLEEEKAQKLEVHNDKPPTITIDDRYRRLKNDLKMDAIKRQQALEQKALTRRRQAMTAQIDARNALRRSEAQYNSEMEAYYKGQADSYNSLKEQSRTKRWENYYRNHADDYAKKARDHRNRR